MLNVLGFLICSVVVMFSGTQLSKSGDQLANLTGISKGWIGLILMATVTSLPELVTGISAVRFVGAPDLAAGNILGSCTFNLLLLSVLDLLVKKPVMSTVKSSHIVTASFSIILLAITGLAMTPYFNRLSFLWINPLSLVLMGVYLITVRVVFNFERSESKNSDYAISKEHGFILRVVSIYCLHALIIVCAALLLPYFGSRVASHFQIADTFFGTVFLAISTSLPEVVVSISAIRLGVPDMAIGNLLGSNIFNIAILGVLDLCYSKGTIFSVVAQSHIMSIFSALIMTAIVAIGLVIRPDRKRWRLGFDGLVIIVIYLINVLVLL